MAADHVPATRARHRPASSRSWPSGEAVPLSRPSLQHSHPDVLRRMGRARRRRVVSGPARAGPALGARCVVCAPPSSWASPARPRRTSSTCSTSSAKRSLITRGALYTVPRRERRRLRLKPSVPDDGSARERLDRLNRVLGEVAEQRPARQVGSTRRRHDRLRSAWTTAGEGPEAVGRTRGQAPEVDGVVHVEGALPGGAGAGT